MEFIYSQKFFEEFNSGAENLCDHFAVKCQLTPKKLGIEKKEVTFRRLNQIDFDKFNSDFFEELKGFDQLCA